MSVTLSAGARRTLSKAPTVGHWIGLRPDGRFIVRTGKVELGQGIHSALLQIAADALGTAPDLLVLEPVSTADSPDEGATSGSLSVQDSGSLIAAACHCLKTAVIRREAERLGLAEAEIACREGSIVGPVRGLPIGLGSAIIDADWRQAIDGAQPIPVAAGPFVGTSVRRADIPARLDGSGPFVQDMTLPGMLHARVLRGRSHRAVLQNAAALLQTVPPGVRWHHDGEFHALLGLDEDAVVRAWHRCRERGQWTTPGSAIPADPMDPDYRSQPADSSVLLRTHGKPAGAGARRHAARYTRPHLAHASIGPSCALARVQDGVVDVWCHSQNVFGLKRDLALALRIDAARVRVHHRAGAGCYGHNGADDAALDAALLASAAKAPVRLQWMREDELSVAPFGPATAVFLEATLDADARIAQWSLDAWSAGHSSRPARFDGPSLLASWQIADGFPEPVPANLPVESGGGTERNAVPIYTLPDCRITTHRLTDVRTRTSSMRALGAHPNVFAIESFMDELAELAGIDPCEFRLRHLDDPRAREVLDRAAGLAAWPTRRTWLGDGQGLGLAVSRYKGSGAYCAVAALVTVAESLRIDRLFIAIDVGRVVTPDGVINQIEGGAIQSASWTVREAVTFDADGVTSGDWETYPILRFSEVPAVEVSIVDRPDLPSLGAGEAAQGPTAAAIANALHDALGVRVRDMPISLDRITAAIHDS